MISVIQYFVIIVMPLKALAVLLETLDRFSYAQRSLEWFLHESIYIDKIQPSLKCIQLSPSQVLLFLAYWGIWTNSKDTQCKCKTFSTYLFGYTSTKNLLRLLQFLGRRAIWRVPPNPPQHTAYDPACRCHACCSGSWKASGSLGTESLEIRNQKFFIHLKCIFSEHAVQNKPLFAFCFVQLHHCPILFVTWRAMSWTLGFLKGICLPYMVFWWVWTHGW